MSTIFQHDQKRDLQKWGDLIFSIFMTRLYNRTNISSLAPALLHPAANTFGTQFSSGAISDFLLL